MSFNPLVSEGESSDDDIPLASPLKTAPPVLRSPSREATIEPSEEEDDKSSEGEEQIQNDAIKSKIPMSASVMLTKLPESTNKVISKLENFKEEGETEKQILKITIRCNPIGSTPPLKPNVFKISKHQHFSTLIKFIGKKLKRKEGVFVYLNNSFAPGPDEVIGNLYKVSICVILADLDDNKLTIEKAFW